MNFSTVKSLHRCRKTDNLRMEEFLDYFIIFIYWKEPKPSMCRNIHKEAMCFLEIKEFLAHKLFAYLDIFCMSKKESCASNLLIKSHYRCVHRTSLSLDRNTRYINKKGKISKINKCCYLLETKLNGFMQWININRI